MPIVRAGFERARDCSCYGVQDCRMWETTRPACPCRWQSPGNLGGQRSACPGEDFELKASCPKISRGNQKWQLGLGRLLTIKGCGNGFSVSLDGRGLGVELSFVFQGSEFKTCPHYVYVHINGLHLGFSDGKYRPHRLMGRNRVLHCFSKLISNHSLCAQRENHPIRACSHIRCISTFV